MQTLEKQPITTFIPKSKAPNPKNNFKVLMALLIGIILRSFDQCRDLQSKRRGGNFA